MPKKAKPVVAPPAAPLLPAGAETIQETTAAASDGAAAAAPSVSAFTAAAAAPAPVSDLDAPVHEDRRWRDNGWTAQVIKNEDDDGWAVAMTVDGQSEPALIGPWTMGRDKKNPKPLDTAAFHTLVKTASEFVRRQEQQLYAALHRAVEIAHGEERISVRLDIEPDEDNPRATLSAVDAAGDVIASRRVAPGFHLTRASAAAWAQGGFGD